MYIILITSYWFEYLILEHGKCLCKCYTQKSSKNLAVLINRICGSPRERIKIKFFAKPV